MGLRYGFGIIVVAVGLIRYFRMGIHGEDRSRKYKGYKCKTYFSFHASTPYSLIPEDTIVSMMLLWQKMKIVIGTIIMITATAAVAPALEIPAAEICESA